MKNKKLSEKELQALNDYQIKTNEVIAALGSVELQINALKTQKEEILKDFKGKAAVSEGEAFDTSPSNIDARIETTYPG